MGGEQLLECIVQDSLTLLFVEEILHHLGCVNPCKSWVLTISTGAGFLPSTVRHDIRITGHRSNQDVILKWNPK